MVKKTFRDGNYYRHVRIGKRTVKEGECAAIWTCDGKRKTIVGPQRVRLFFSHVRFMNRHVANPNQFLVVEHRDGRKDHHRGPIAMFMDPCLHMKISTHDAFKLAANEVMVVYSEDPTSTSVDGKPVVEAAAASKGGGGAGEKTDESSSAVGIPGAVRRRLVHGPAVFIPGADEWVHQFSWHGSVANGKGSKTGSPGDEKVPHALNFEKLRKMPDQMYLSVKGVRTTDDAQITIHLMLFFELKQVERMLDSTNDPMGDFISAASADVMSFGASNTYEGLLQRGTAQLSDVSTFPILAGRMSQVGFELLKIVYRGYSASETLQTMHDQAIAKRTKLKLDTDTRAMEQAQQARELDCKQERSRAERELETAARQHQAEMADKEHTQAVRHAAERQRAELEAARAKNDEELRVNEALKALGVDLTQYLCVSAQKEPDQHIRVDGGGAGGATMPAAIHLEVPRGRK